MKHMEVKDVLASARFRDDKLSKVNLFESPHFFCDLYCLRQGQSQKVHAHPVGDKFYYALHGEGTVTVGEETRKLRAGEIVLAPQGVAHGIANESAADFVCLVVMAPHPGGKSTVDSRQSTVQRPGKKSTVDSSETGGEVDSRQSTVQRPGKKSTVDS
jgi:quercetin dioxygenase-like cupin family protein